MRAERRAPAPRDHDKKGRAELELCAPRATLTMPPPLRSALRFQESGLLLVILALAGFLTWFSGRVAMPVFETGPDGTPQRVFTTDAAGDRVPLSIERNKFLNPQNLAQ